MTVLNSSRQLHGYFGLLPHLDAETKCSEDFSPRPRRWSTARRDALGIASLSRLTRRRPKLSSSPFGGTLTRSRRRLAAPGSNHICRTATPYL